MRSSLVDHLLSEPARSRGPHPLRTLSLLAGGALVLVVALVGSAARGDAPTRAFFSQRPVHADTDSVALTPVVPMRADTDSVALTPVVSARADTDSVAFGLVKYLPRADTDSVAFGLVKYLPRDPAAAPALIDTSFRVRRYLSVPRSDRQTASLFPRARRPLSGGVASAWRHELALDSTSATYTARETVGGEDVRYPLQVDRATYRREQLQLSLKRNWRQIAAQRARQRQNQSSGLGVNIRVPGGRQSAFTTVFGKDEVALRVTGQADIKAGFDVRKSDQQQAFGTGTQVDPDFKQDLSLGVTGTIGDKMRVDVNWDTKRDFDYQNQLKLQYTGYDDEIIQSIEAGNVFLQTPSTLIRGGQSLFGIKTQFKVGGVQLTMVASQQEGQSNSVALEGGAETTTFDLKPLDYDERTHYFLAYYFRNRWEDALSAPPNILVDGQFERITDVEVWKLEAATATGEQTQSGRQVIAVVDLGESEALIEEADRFTQAVLPSRDIDQYDDNEIEDFLRPNDTDTPPVESFLTDPGQMEVPLTSSDYQEGKFKKLFPGRDYEIDQLLGFLTLKQRIRDGEALAISFRYLAGGTSFQVGDFSSETGGGDNNSARLVLKLLKPINLKQPSSLGGPNEINPAAWYLEMRNIYRLGRGLKANEFELEINYTPPGKSSSKTLPGLGSQETLLQSLGLDRVNENGAPRPDNLFDYLVNYTINPSDGLLIFPYLEPFGQRIESLIDQSSLSDPDAEDARDLFVLSELYALRKDNAQNNFGGNLDVYRIAGSYKGSIQDFYDLRAYSGLVEGSVRVTSGGTTLQEGADYIVDYQGGTVTITNASYLTAGRNIEIDYEQNALINLQQKTLLGARVDYSTNERFALGGTLMRLSQKSLTDKFRIGEEPISNAIWGVDGRLDLEPRVLTRLVDALPLLQTKEPSAINITGEFAQLLPGHTQTNAFEATRRDLRDDGFDFSREELDGISFLDDFESFENTFSLMRPSSWLLAAPPLTVQEDGQEVLLTAAERSVLAWYQLNVNTLQSLEAAGAPINRNDVRLFDPRDIFPSREVSSQDRTLAPLDVYFTPRERGPYNYTTNLGGFLDQPQAAWAGMTQRLAEGYTDFNLKNIEFIEFIVQPFAEDGTSAQEGTINPEARLYVDLGLISEDVIPDSKLNTEDGLSLTEPGNNFSSTGARLSTGVQDQVINPIRSGERATEDLGLDGLASFPNNDFAGTAASEATAYADFIQSLDAASANPYYAREVAKAQRDPSGDDYHYFLDNTFFNNETFYPGGALVQQRFSRFFAGQELNSFEGQSELAEGPSQDRIGNSRFPDSEDINLNSTLDTENSYYQYDLALDSLDFYAAADQVDDYVVEEVSTGWYLVRIPVRDFKRCFGAFRTDDGCTSDFSLIESIRLWTTGHNTPMTLRFATFELVGSQWRKSDAVTLELDMPADTSETLLSVESINNEENAQTYAIPRSTILNQIRQPTGELLKTKEQSLLLRVENLRPGQQRAVFQTYNQGLDLLKYNTLKMFVHLHGEADGEQLGGDRSRLDVDRDKVKLFVRLGANETSDYYEYEQSLTPSPVVPPFIGEAEVGDPEYLWRTSEPNPDPEGPDRIDVNSMNILLGALNQLKFLRDESEAPTDSTFWNDENNVLEETVDGFAPPGTRIGIRGTPSLSNINTIIIGIRNPADPGGPVLDDATIWVNELRVAGYDEEPGTAALLNATIKLADLAQIKTNFSMQTDGFGGLASSLGDREQVNIRDWAVNTQFNLDKFIPERYGWSIPVTMEVKERTSTPRFDPNRGDVRVDELLQAIEDDESLSADSINLRKDEITQAAQTYDFTRSFTSRISKRGSRSSLLRNTLDGLSLTYSYADSDGRTPNLETRNSWRWSSALNYRLAVRKPRVFRPFGPLGGVPVLGVLGGLRFNYLPTSLTLSANAARRYSESKERLDPLRRQEDRILPESVEFPLRPQHTFTHNRKFGLQYNPLEFLNLSFDTNTDQSLNDVGSNIITSVILVDSLGTETRQDETTLQQLIDAGTIDSTDIGVSAFEVEKLDVVPLGSVLNDIRSGSDELRTETYQSRFTATFRPRIESIEALSWLTLQDVVYGTGFSWRNGPVGNNFGAAVGTTIDLRGGLTVRPKELFQKISLYRTLEEQQKRAALEAKAAREERAFERKQRREQKKLEKERREQEEALRKAMEEGGQLPPEAGGAEAQPPPEGPPQPAGQPPPEGQPPPQGQPPPADGVAPGLPGAAPVEADTTATSGGFRLPLPHPVSILRQSFLAVTGVERVNVSYTGNRSSTATNVGRLDESGNVAVNYTLLDAFKGNGPSLGYRFGLTNTIDDAQRVFDGQVQVTDALTQTDQLRADTKFKPTPTLSIDLTWSLKKTNRDNVTLRRNNNGIVEATPTQNGSNGASVWAFNASYLDLFTSQLETLRRDLQTIDSTGTINSTVLTNEAVTQDFLATYLSGPGAIDRGGRLPFPMPGWHVTYSGISTWPLIRLIAQNASLAHDYKADYDADYRSNQSADPTGAFPLPGGTTIEYTIPEIEVGSVRVNERFQPLVGLNLSLKGGIRADVAWNKSNSYTLSTTNNVVNEIKTGELTFSTAYQRRGLTLPFLPFKRLNNNISFSLAVSRLTNDERTFFIRRAIEAASQDADFDPALALEEPFVSVLRTTTRLTVSPKISYQFSNRVTADAFVRYERFEGDNLSPSTTNVNGGFNFRVSIAN